MLWFVQQSVVLLVLAWVLGLVSGWLVFGRSRRRTEDVTDLVRVVQGTAADDAARVPAQSSADRDEPGDARPVADPVPGRAPEPVPAPVPGPRAVAPRTPSVVPRPATRRAAQRPAGTDDLTRIDGVTPAISDALRAAGLVGFGDVARASIGDLRAALDDAGLPPTFRCAYWPLMAGDLEAAAAQAAETAAETVAEAVAAPVAPTVPEAVTETATDEVAATVDVTDVPDVPAAVTVDVTAPVVDVTAPGPKPLLDEFERIDGVTLSAARALRSAGLASFADVAEAPVGRLREALTAAGVRVAPTVQTWSTQARRLAASDEGAARAAARSGTRPAARAAGTGARQ